MAVTTSSKSPSRAEKLIRVLGEAPTHILDKLSAETKPWYLRPTYSEKEILIDPDGKVRAGTVPALVERLTAHEHSGKCGYLPRIALCSLSYSLDTLQTHHLRRPSS